jgi:rRNA processing protein Krr1/Pno1
MQPGLDEMEAREIIYQILKGKKKKKIYFKLN